MLPSARQLASDFLVNPLTAARAYRELEEYTETRRGIGLIVKEGVRQILMDRERKQFLREEWPAIRARIKALEIDVNDLPRSETLADARPPDTLRFAIDKSPPSRAPPRRDFANGRSRLNARPPTEHRRASRARYRRPIHPPPDIRRAE
jgi:DNA-binding transcriptional MocR family regulator